MSICLRRARAYVQIRITLEVCARCGRTGWVTTRRMLRRSVPFWGINRTRSTILDARTCSFSFETKIKKNQWCRSSIDANLAELCWF